MKYFYKVTSSGFWPDARDYYWSRIPAPNQLSQTGTGINQCDTRCEHGLKLANLFVTGYKVMFLLVSVILLTVEGLPQCMLGRKHPPGRRQCMLGRKHPPGRKQCMLGRKHTLPGKEAVHARKEAPPQHTVNERPVRILLECILVNLNDLKLGSFYWLLQHIKFLNIWLIESSLMKQLKDNTGVMFLLN